jgi:hypothetical protein
VVGGSAKRPAGKRAGSRRGPKPARTFQPALLGLALAITACVVAWGYLVYAAVDFGASARGGDAQAWWFLGVASIGAVACLFFGFMLVARLLRRLGITQPPPSQRPTAVGDVAGHTAGDAAGHTAGDTAGDTAEVPVVPAARPVGGRRAAR